MKKAFFRTITLVLSLSVLICINSPEVAASSVYTPAEVLRIGLTSKYGNTDSISIQNKSITIGIEKNGVYLSQCALSSQGGFTVLYQSAYYVKSGAFSNYNDTKNYSAGLRAAGHSAAPCLVEAESFAAYTGPYGNHSAALTAATSLGGVVVPSSTQNIVIKDGDDIVLIVDVAGAFPQIADGSADGAVFVGDDKYRGRIEIGRYSGQNMTAINIVSMEEYLNGAVSAETPSKWHTEALKAQAVASRSYAADRAGVHSEDGYHLCDSTHCQLYNGMESESQAINDAVSATRGVYAYYDGKPISAVFFASSGGTTDNSENVWTSKMEYLRGVSDTYESGAKIWERRYTLDDITKALLSNGVSIGSATGVSISAVENGRVQELLISGANGEKRLVKEEIRTFFSSLPGGSLESRNFTLSGVGVTASAGQTTANDSVHITDGYNSSRTALNSLYALGNNGPVAVTGSVITAVSSSRTHEYGSSAPAAQSAGSSAGVIVFTGKGNGHGVGMSQTGAQSMAEAGFTYQEILKWYYTGVEVR